MILCKLPTRERPEKAFNTLKGYIDNASNNDNIIYLISYDVDDYKMNNQNVLKKYSELHKNIILIPGKSLNKVNAINRDIDKIKDWDILIVAADDMICMMKDWDNIICEEMKKHFPDDDGVLHFSDGFAGNKLNTMPIFTRKYYDRFKYIYHPSYKSLWCDNEFMKVADILKKQVYINKVLFMHKHYANVGGLRDKLIQYTESFYWDDKKTFENRKRINFDL